MLSGSPLRPGGKAVPRKGGQRMLLLSNCAHLAVPRFLLPSRTKVLTSRMVSVVGVRSVFLCFAGHGGSFPAVPRLSDRQYTQPCDLCGRVHHRRLPRDPGAAAWSWVRWVHQDTNPAFRGAEQTQSSEHDQLLFVEEGVLTPFGPGRIIGRRKVPASYHMLVSVEGAKCSHCYLYDVELRCGREHIAMCTTLLLPPR